MAGLRKRIVIIEGNRSLAGQIASCLRKEGCSVDIAGGGEDILALARSSRPDLAILGALLGDSNGAEIVRRLRSDPRTAELPVIMIAGSSEEGQLLLSGDVGADDFVTRPVDMAMLAARVSALLRRSGGARRGGRAMQIGPIHIEPDHHEIAVNGEPVSLTLTEFRMLLALAAAKGQVLTRNQLIDQAIGMDAIVTDRTIDVHITALRRKLAGAKNLLKTVRGIGYKMLPEGGESD